MCVLYHSAAVDGDAGRIDGGFQSVIRTTGRSTDERMTQKKPSDSRQVPTVFNLREGERGYVLLQLLRPKGNRNMHEDVESRRHRH